MGAGQPGRHPHGDNRLPETYDAAGWTIAATESGTRFTNEHTGHGMFVSIEKVDTF